MTSIEVSDLSPIPLCFDFQNQFREKFYFSFETHFSRKRQVKPSSF